VPSDIVQVKKTFRKISQESVKVFFWKIAEKTFSKNQNFAFLAKGKQNESCNIFDKRLIEKRMTRKTFSFKV